MTMDVHLHRLGETAERTQGPHNNTTTNNTNNTSPGSATGVFLPRESGTPIRHKRSFDVAFLTGQDIPDKKPSNGEAAAEVKPDLLKQQDIPGSAFTKVSKCESSTVRSPGTDVGRMVPHPGDYPGFAPHFAAIPFLQHGAPGKAIGMPLFAPGMSTGSPQLLPPKGPLMFPNLKDRPVGSKLASGSLMENYLKTQQALYGDKDVYPPTSVPSAFQTSALASKIRPGLYPDLYNFTPYSYLTLGPELATRPQLLPPSPVSTLLPPSLTALTLPAQNVCAKCNVGFRMTSDLVYHMRSHHKRETDPLKRKREDKLKCPVCNESFRERHHLTRHMTAHQDKEEDAENVKK